MNDFYLIFVYFKCLFIFYKSPRGIYRVVTRSGGGSILFFLFQSPILPILPIHKLRRFSRKNFSSITSMSIKMILPHIRVLL